MCSESIGRVELLGEGAAAFLSASGSSASVPARLAWRASLLASASLAALMAVGEPSGAWAGCTPKTQNVSTAVTGPVRANGGNIIVQSGGSITGGPEGVFAQNCGINQLTNSGSIGAANGAPGDAGGIGVRANSGQTINLLSNAAGAAISGGKGGLSLTSSEVGVGGAGVSNSGTVRTLANSGTIGGGNGGGGQVGGTGGAGVANSDTITTLTNRATIRGGAGGDGSSGGGGGGIGLSNKGTLTTLSNSGAIIGGSGGSGLFFGGMGGVGVWNSGTVRTLTNSGAITGGAGGGGDTSGAVGFGGSGIVNSGTIRTLTNSGTISGGRGGSTLSGGAGGAGVWNSGTIRALTNRGTISGGAGGGTTSSANSGGAGGAGVLNTSGATIGSLRVCPETSRGIA